MYFCLLLLFRQIHDGIIAAKLVYGLGKVRFDYKYRKWINYRKTERTPLFLFDGAPTDRPLPLSKLWKEMYSFGYYDEKNLDGWNNMGTSNDSNCISKKDKCTKNFKNFMNILNETETETETETKTKNRLDTTKIWYLSSDIPKASPLLWGIFIEEHAERVSVWVKGSDGYDSDEDLSYWNDWAGKNSNCDREEWDGIKGFERGKIKVHGGYRDAVDANYATIVDQLHELYTNSEIKDTIKDYKVYVFGHSMGAATSQLIAYRLALNKYTNDGKEKDLPAPISNINFSAPQTGDKDWYSSSMVLEREGMLRNLRAYHRDDWAPTSAGGSQPGLFGGACTLTLGNYYDVGVQMRVDFPNPIRFIHAQEENDLQRQGPDYTPSRRLDGEVDEGHDQSSRALGTKTGTLPAPYNFIDEYESCSNAATCLNVAAFYHKLETMLMEVYIANRDKKGEDEDLDSKSLNQLYERYLG